MGDYAEQLFFGYQVNVALDVSHSEDKKTDWWQVTPEKLTITRKPLHLSAAGWLTTVAVARLQPESFASHDRNSDVANDESPF
jgi:hypothetical protein